MGEYQINQKRKQYRKRSTDIVNRIKKYPSCQ